MKATKPLSFEQPTSRLQSLTTLHRSAFLRMSPSTRFPCYTLVSTHAPHSPVHDACVPRRTVVPPPVKLRACFSSLSHALLQVTAQAAKAPFCLCIPDCQPPTQLLPNGPGEGGRQRVGGLFVDSAFLSCSVGGHCDLLPRGGWEQPSTFPSPWAGGLWCSFSLEVSGGRQQAGRWCWVLTQSLPACTHRTVDTSKPGSREARTNVHSGTANAVFKHQVLSNW